MSFYFAGFFHIKYLKSLSFDSFHLSVHTALLKIHVYFSIRTTQRYLQLIGVQNQARESALPLIIDALKELLQGTGQNLGVAALWRKLRREKNLHVKRLVCFTDRQYQ